jgi:hypothetical protein
LRSTTAYREAEKVKRFRSPSSGCPGGGGCSVAEGLREYPELTNRRRFLKALYQKIQEGYDIGSDLVLVTVSAPPLPRVVTSFPRTRTSQQESDRSDIGEELGLRGAEAVALWRRLEQGGYISTTGGKSQGTGIFKLFFLEHLTDKGLREIGELPHPDQRFIEVIEEVLRRIEENPDVPEAEKARLRKLAEAAISFAKDTGRMGLMQFVLQHMNM